MDRDGHKLGIALGSGSARGWAHIGALRALEERGLAPDVVTGTSIGALVGAAYVAGQLDRLEAFARSLEWRDVVGYLDLSFSGGLIRARRLFDYFAEHFEDVAIEDLDRPFAAIATDLGTGQEVWMTKGSLLEAVRASIAIPGLITPVRRDGRWLSDGGMVNPVPIAPCRALGADWIVGVELQTVLLGRRFEPELQPPQASTDAGEADAPAPETAPAEAGQTARAAAEAGLPALLEAQAPAGTAAPAEGVSRSEGMWHTVRERARELMAHLGSGPEEPEAPSIFEVVSHSINIMQVRITRSRMAGDPPDLLVVPRLPEMGLMDFHLAGEAIEEGRRAVELAVRLNVEDTRRPAD